MISFQTSALLASLLVLLSPQAWGQAGKTTASRDDEITVTATRVEREVFETPQAVTVVQETEIEQSNVLDVPDLLRFAEGIYVQRTNLGGGSPFIRGLTGKQVLILIDGVRLNNSYYRFGPHQYLNTIDPNSIERIEVVRGPGSVLYGSDALGGVINIITKKRSDFTARTDLGGEVTPRLDSAVDGGSGSGRIDGNWERLGFVAGVSAKRLNDLKAGGGMGAQVPSGYDEIDADLTLNYRFREESELIFANQLVRQFDVPKTSEVTLGDKLQFDYEPQDRRLHYVEYRTQELGWFDQFAANVSYHRQREGEVIVARATPDLESRELTDVGTLGTVVHVTKSMGSRDNEHRLTSGVDFYRDEFDNAKVLINRVQGDRASNPPFPGVPNGAAYRSTGVYLQDEMRWGRRLELVSGLRYSDYLATGTVRYQAGDGKFLFEPLDLRTGALTGSANGLFRLTPSLNLVGGVAQGFRAPNMEDLFGRVDFFQEIPNTQLEPEKSFDVDAGLKYLALHTSAELYYYSGNYRGLIDRVTVGKLPDGSPIKQRRNIGTARIHGVEAALTQFFSEHWSGSATVAWTRGENSETDEPLRRIPPLNGTARLRYGHPRYWVEFQGLFADRQTRLSGGDIDDPRIPDGGTPGYLVANLQGSWRFSQNQDLLITFENLFDKLYKTHGSGIYAPGRSLVLSCRFRFE